MIDTSVLIRLAADSTKGLTGHLRIRYNPGLRDVLDFRFVAQRKVPTATSQPHDRLHP